MYIIVILLGIIKFCDGEPEGTCGPYHGEICKKYVHSSKIVWYNNSGGFENEEITSGLWDEMIVTFEEPCRSAAEVN